MAKSVVPIVCPKCSCPVVALVDSIYLFVLYRCPECRSNVISYEDRVITVSSKLITKLIENGRLKIFSGKRRSSEVARISEDQIRNLRLLLETEKDFDTFLKKI